MDKNLLNLKNARVPEQKQQMKEIAQRGICPFCRVYFEDHHKNPILKETDFWLLTKNDYPYDGATIHLLLVHKEHIETPSKISPEASEELANILSWAEKKYKLAGATFIMRFGNMKYTGATIAHLHAHIVSGVAESKNSKPLKKKIGFMKK